MSLDGKHLKRKLELDIPKAMGESISHTFSSTGCRAPKKRQAMVYSRSFRHTGLFCKGKDWVLDAYSGFLLQTSWITRKNKKKSTDIRLYLQLHNVLFENTDFAVTDMQPDHLEDSKQDLTGITYHHHKINTKHWDNYSNSQLSTLYDENSCTKVRRQQGSVCARHTVWFSNSNNKLRVESFS